MSPEDIKKFLESQVKTTKNPSFEEAIKEVERQQEVDGAISAGLLSATRHPRILARLQNLKGGEKA